LIKDGSARQLALEHSPHDMQQELLTSVALLYGLDDDELLVAEDQEVQGDGTRSSRNDSTSTGTELCTSGFVASQCSSCFDKTYLSVSVMAC
jgi:hypothetical protein